MEDDRRIHAAAALAVVAALVLLVVQLSGRPARAKASGPDWLARISPFGSAPSAEPAPADARGAAEPAPAELAPPERMMTNAATRRFSSPTSAGSSGGLAGAEPAAPDGGASHAPMNATRLAGSSSMDFPSGGGGQAPTAGGGGTPPPAPGGGAGRDSAGAGTEASGASDRGGAAGGGSAAGSGKKREGDGKAAASGAAGAGAPAGAVSRGASSPARADGAGSGGGSGGGTGGGLSDLSAGKASGGGGPGDPGGGGGGGGEGGMGGKVMDAKPKSPNGKPVDGGKAGGGAGGAAAAAAGGGPINAGGGAPSAAAVIGEPKVGTGAVTGGGLFRLDPNSPPSVQTGVRLAPDGATKVVTYTAKMAVASGGAGADVAAGAAPAAAAASPDPEEVPFIVLPDDFKTYHPEVKVNDCVSVTYGAKTLYAIVGDDKGPTSLIGDGSKALARGLGIANEGVGGNVRYVIVPGSGGASRPSTAPQIQIQCKKSFETAKIPVQ